eukprot:gene2571-763_t
MANKVTKMAVAKVKGAGYRDSLNSLERKDRQQKAMRIAKHRNKKLTGVYQAKIIKGTGGMVLTGDTEIRERWKEY